MDEKIAAAFEALLGRQTFDDYLRRVQRSPSVYELSVEERLAFFVYTTAFGWHQTINTQLWSKRPSPEVQTVAATIDSGLTKLPRFNGLVYRGVRPHSALGDFLTDYEPGQIVIWPGLTSSARHRELALVAPVMFSIWSQNGRIATLVSADPGELEILFSTGTRFRVIAVKRVGSRAFVQMDEVGSHEGQGTKGG